MKDEKIKESKELFRKDIQRHFYTPDELFDRHILPLLSQSKKECGLPTDEEITDVAEFSADTFKEVEAFEKGAKWMRDKASHELDALRAENERLKQGLHGIYNLCDNDNPTHEHIWRVANDLLH